MKKILPIAVLLLICQLNFAQNVGIGTTNPLKKLHVSSSLDTSLIITNNGILFSPGTEKVRLGIHNVIDNLTPGSRMGMLTEIAFPNNTFGPEDVYIGHEIRFDGFCNPFNCNNASDIFGVKVEIPLFPTSGNRYAFYGDGGAGYGGYFLGKGHFSSNVGIGSQPGTAEMLYVGASTSTNASLNRAARFFISTLDTDTNDKSGIIGQIVGRSSANNMGGNFISTVYNGTGMGLRSIVNHTNTGLSYGLFTENTSNGGSRSGIRAEVTGSGTGTVSGIHSYVAGNNGTSTVYGLRSNIISGATAGSSFAVYGANSNSGANAYSGYFVGKASIVSGEDASYSSDGYLRLGYDNNVNLILDNNEILARDDGGPAPLYIQNDGGDVLLCSGELGGVGIGILSANSIPDGYLLAVDGKGIFEELRVEISGSWPDYVFQDDYSLKSLPELKKYIGENGHLPNIPNAKTIEEEGILLGDMQKRMMEKIEELSLYIIELEERLAKIENQK